MTRYATTLRETFAPPTEAWWFPVVATGVTVLLLTFFLIGLAIRRFSAPLTPGERLVARSPLGLRLLLAGVVPVAALAVVFAVVVLAFGPRLPTLIRASSGATPEDDTRSLARIPEHLRHLPV